MHNATLKEFLLNQSKTAQYITSVCTGAFILATAGLLEGKRATTYHSAFEELQAYNNVIVDKNKVVHDGNIITAAGVSSGLELGFYIIKLLFGNVQAKEIAKKIEYNIDIDTL